MEEEVLNEIEDPEIEGNENEETVEQPTENNTWIKAEFDVDCILSQEDAMKDGRMKSHQELIEIYMDRRAKKSIPARKGYTDGKHTIEGCVEHIKKMARKGSKGGSASVDMMTVFAWAEEYFINPIEVKQQPKFKTKSPEQIEKEKVEAKRKEEERKAAEAARKREEKKKEDVRKNGLSLFDF